MAMNHYHRLRKLSKMRQMLKILFALAAFSWSSTRLPSLLNLAAQFLVKAYKYLVSPHVTFTTGNASIVVVVLLSRCNNPADAAFDFSDEIIPTTPPGLTAETAKMRAINKEMVVAPDNVAGEEGGGASPHRRKSGC